MKPLDSNPFQPNDRQEDILEIIATSGFAETEATARHFDKSTQTIRRDFAELEKHGFVLKVHGGARAAGEFKNPPYAERLSESAREKDAIGRAAAALIPNDACVFLSLGTSTEAVARNMYDHKGMQFVTNNLNIAKLLNEASQSDLMLCGGPIRAQDGAMLGPQAIEMVTNMRFDYGLIGIGAIDDEGNLYSYSIDEVKMGQAIIKNAHISILVADEKKFGGRANHKMCNLADINKIITNSPPDAGLIQLCRDNDVEILSPPAAGAT